MTQYIDLGDGQRIELAPLDIQPGRALEMDAIAPQIFPLWDALETICVTGCCGMDALDFSAEQLAAARRQLDVAPIRQGLLELQTRLLQPGPPVVMSLRLNQYLDRAALQQLIAHLLHHL